MTCKPFLPKWMVLFPREFMLTSWIFEVEKKLATCLCFDSSCFCSNVLIWRAFASEYKWQTWHPMHLPNIGHVNQCFETNKWKQKQCCRDISKQHCLLLWRNVRLWSNLSKKCMWLNRNVDMCVVGRSLTVDVQKNVTFPQVESEIDNKRFACIFAIVLFDFQEHGSCATDQTRANDLYHPKLCQWWNEQMTHRVTNQISSGVFSNVNVSVSNVYLHEFRWPNFVDITCLILERFGIINNLDSWNTSDPSTRNMFEENCGGFWNIYM